MFPFEIRKISCEIACADPEGGGGGGPDPLEIHKLYGFLQKLAFGPPAPPKEKVAPPLEKVGPHLKP